MSRIFNGCRIAAVVACALSGLAAGELRAQAKPYSLDDLLTLVRGGVPPTRLANLVGTNCLAFTIDQQSAARLRQAGAGDEVISRLSGVCVVTQGPRLSVGSTDLALDPALIAQTRLTYSIRALLLITSEGVIDVRRGTDQGRPVFTLTYTYVASDLQQRSETVIDAQTLASLRFHLRKDARNGGNVEMDMRRDGDRIRGWAAGSNGARVDIDQPVFQNSILPGAEDLILQAASIEVGQSFSFSTFNTNTSQPCTMTLRVAGERSIRVAAGTFDTFEIHVNGCDQNQKLYVRKEAPHVMVKGDMTTTKIDLRAIAM